MKEGGLLRFLFVWGEKGRKRDRQIMEVMREKRKMKEGKWGKMIGMERRLRKVNVFEV